MPRKHVQTPIKVRVQFYDNNYCILEIWSAIAAREKSLRRKTNKSHKLAREPMWCALKHVTFPEYRSTRALRQTNDNGK